MVGVATLPVEDDAVVGASPSVAAVAGVESSDTAVAVFMSGEPLAGALGVEADGKGSVPADDLTKM